LRAPLEETAQPAMEQSTPAGDGSRDGSDWETDVDLTYTKVT
jgi:hypothetical protein